MLHDAQSTLVETMSSTGENADKQAKQKMRRKQRHKPNLSKTDERRRKATAFDSMLDEGLTENVRSSDGQVERRLGQLQAKLQGRKEKARSKDPATMLASRAMKPKKTKKEGDVRQTLAKVLLDKEGVELRKTMAPPMRRQTTISTLTWLS